MEFSQIRLERARQALIHLDDRFSFREFAQQHPMHRSTAYRDWQQLLKRRIIQKIGCTSDDTRVPVYKRSQVR